MPDIAVVIIIATVLVALYMIAPKIAGYKTK
jgi:hypothetical protein